MREGEEGKTEKETRRKREERIRDGRDQPSQLQRERTASLANHSRFSSRVARFLLFSSFEIESRENGTKRREILSSHRRNHRVTSFRHLQGVPIFSARISPLSLYISFFPKGRGRWNRLDTLLIWTCSSRFPTF